MDRTARRDVYIASDMSVRYADECAVGMGSDYQSVQEPFDGYGVIENNPRAICAVLFENDLQIRTSSFFSNALYNGLPMVCG